ncbi:hypothetical protein [uncultured Stenotrophomonas sp.]|uniref:hypothetical protein n=1 Tax=uncultured Stenotrophomonas sp. TaxID=165438 RepID=UPI0025CFC407|nr:hypothetical protein [uncultured Stenotrophomonas sp.]
MDHDVKYEFQKLQMRVDAAERNIEHTAGRVLALQAALTATLNAWGKDPATVSVEVDRVFNEFSASGSQIQMPPAAWNTFRDLRVRLTDAIQAAVQAP